MNILVLGGNRFVGRRVVEVLKKMYKVTIFNRTGTLISEVSTIQGDRNISTASFANYDLILDFCLFKPAQANALLTQVRDNQKYLFISSAAVYEYQSLSRPNENSSVGGSTLFGEYGLEKSICEDIIKQSSLDYMILRPTYIVGPGSHRPRLSYYFSKIENGEEIKFDGQGDALVDLVWVDDMVDVVVDMVANWKSREVFNIASGTGISLVKLSEQISLFLNKPFNAKYGALAEQCPFPNAELLADPTKLNKAFKPIQERFEEFYNWYNREGKQKHGYK